MLLLIRKLNRSLRLVDGLGRRGWLIVGLGFVIIPASLRFLLAQVVSSSKPVE